MRVLQALSFYPRCFPSTIAVLSPSLPFWRGPLRVSRLTRACQVSPSYVVIPNSLARLLSSRPSRCRSGALYSPLRSSSSLFASCLSYASGFSFVSPCISKLAFFFRCSTGVRKRKKTQNMRRREAVRLKPLYLFKFLER